MRQKTTLLLILLLSILRYGNSQSFSIPELNSFVTLNYEKLDSLLLANNYKKGKDESGQEYRISAYLNAYKEGEEIYTRSVIIGYDYKVKNVDVTYRLSNKTEADKIIYWLTENGFVFNTTTIEDIAGGKPEKITAYRSKKQSVLLKKTTKKTNGIDVTYYQFEISNMF